jgi:hypothetical protein
VNARLEEIPDPSPYYIGPWKTITDTSSGTVLCLDVLRHRRESDTSFFPLKFMLTNRDSIWTCVEGRPMVSSPMPLPALDILFAGISDAWIEVETFLTGYHARQSVEIVSGVGTSIGVSTATGVGGAVLGNVTLVAQTGTYQIIGFPPKVSSSALSSPTQTEAANLKQTTVEIVEEAKRRLQGHEDLIAQLHSIVEEEASRLNAVVDGIIVRPGWSHEYEDKSSVVLYVDIRGGTETRFSLWDSICEKTGRLANSLPKDVRLFLNENVSIVVNRN